MTFPLAQLLSPLLAAAPYDPVTDIADLLFFNSYKTAAQVLPISRDSASGATRTITAASGSTWRVSNSLGADNGAYHGGTLTLGNYVNAGNNGAFPVTGGNTVTTDYTNASGAAETVGVGVGAQIAAITGYCNSYTDLLGGYVFAQATAAQSLAVSTSYAGAHQTLGIVNSLSRHLGVNSTGLAGQLNGTGDFTLLSYMRPGAVNVSGVPSAWMTFQDAAGTSRIRARYTSATAHTLEIVNAAGNVTTISATLSSGLVLNTWQLLAVVYSGGTATWYLNGVAVGSASGTVRTRAALANVFLGYRSSYPAGTGGTSGHRAVDAAVNRSMAASELLDLTTWCQAEYA
jgi:hypothetical protein